ncbi:MAG: hypothetical protein ABR507_05735 [Actinomycetota bacterium]|nr:hypothetical protein [Actinomycetota bacterium]
MTNRSVRWLVGISVALTAFIPSLYPARATGPVTPSSFSVGADAQDLSPSANLIATKRLFLGGYGLSNGQVGTPGHAVQGPAAKPRYATGVMADPFGPWVRAVAISNGSSTIVMTDLDNQGMFAAYKPNIETGQPRPYGIDDIRAQVSKDIGLDPKNIVVSSDHSHAGQDLTGVWGFVPDEYMSFVKDQAVKAIENAVAAARPAVLKEGAVMTPGPYEPGHILNNQFDQTDTGQDTVDNELRVMQALDATDGSTIATIINFAAHATVGGSGNTLISSDWVSTAARYAEKRYGGVGITLVADVGRSQPARSDCTADEVAGAQAGTNDLDVDMRQLDSCKMSKYARQVMGYVEQIVSSPSFTAVDASPIDATSYFIHEPSTSAVLFGLNYAGDIAGAPISRAVTPPYLAGTVLGTWVSAFRVGDLLITTAPGEAYPNIREQVMAQVSGPRRFWTIGLANDQLGYFISPTPDAYPIAIRHSININTADPSKSGLGNDNYFFNVTHTIGDHVMCKQVQGAADLGFSVVPAAKCAAFFLEPDTSGPGGTRPLA